MRRSCLVKRVFEKLRLGGYEVRGGLVSCGERSESEDRRGGFISQLAEANSETGNS